TSCAWLDFDNDDWLDLFVCNYVQYSLATDHPCYEGGRRYYCRPIVYKPDTCILYRNRGDGTFADVTKQARIWNKTGNSIGVAEDARARAGMGIDVAQYRNYGRPAVLISNVTGEPLSFFVNDGTRQFSDVAFEVGLGEAQLRFLGFGLFFFDYDNDGFKDL